MPTRMPLSDTLPTGLARKRADESTAKIHSLANENDGPDGLGRPALGFVVSKSLDAQDNATPLLILVQCEFYGRGVVR